MTKDEIAHAIGAVQLAINNHAKITHILGHGDGQSNRDIALGLSVEDSTTVLLALLDVLKSL